MKYKTKRNRRWSLLDRFVIMDAYDPTRPYLTRLRILETPWFGILLHKIHLPDYDRNLHDHPWHFVSVILSGGYREDHKYYPGDVQTERVWKPGSARLMKRGELHRISEIFEPCWTLMFVGPNHVDWGFEAKDSRVVSASEYFGKAAYV